jgi:hypothetical protein
MTKDKKNDKYYVQWGMIVTEIPLPMQKKQKMIGMYQPQKHHVLRMVMNTLRSMAIS